MRVLYVEDDRLVGGTVAEVLRGEGWSIDLCEDGAAALARIESPATYDLIITDYDLPCVDGVRLARAARALPHRSRIPIFMLTASHVEAEAHAAGVDLFLRKPEDLGRLVEAVSSYVWSGPRAGDGRFS